MPEANLGYKAIPLEVRKEGKKRGRKKKGRKRDRKEKEGKSRRRKKGREEREKIKNELFFFLVVFS